MRLFVADRTIRSEFIVVVRYLYQLPVVTGTIVFVAISLVSYFRCQILVVSYSVVRLSASIDIDSCWRYQLLLHIKSHYLLINKRHHNPGNRGNCLMIHVVYFGRTYYGTELWVPTMGNQGSTGYLFSCQLSVVRAMPRLRCHTSCLFVWGCGLQILEPFRCPCSAPGVLDRGTGHARYPSKTHALHRWAITITITLFDMWENDCGMGHS